MTFVISLKLVFMKKLFGCVERLCVEKKIFAILPVEKKSKNNVGSLESQKSVSFTKKCVKGLKRAGRRVSGSH